MITQRRLRRFEASESRWDRAVTALMAVAMVVLFAAAWAALVRAAYGPPTPCPVASEWCLSAERTPTP